MGYFIATHDDSNIEHFTTWGPHLSQNGIAGSFAVRPYDFDSINSGVLAMTWEMVRGLQNIQGHEVIFHGLSLFDHDSTTLKQDVNLFEQSIVTGRARLMAEGINERSARIYADTPSTPDFGDVTYGQTIGNIIARNFDGRRRADGGLTTDPLETLPVGNPYAVRAPMYFGSGGSLTTFANWQTVLSNCRNNPRSVVVGVFHGNAASYGQLQCTDAIYKQIINEVVYQRDNGVASSGASPGGQLKTATLSQLIRGELKATD